MADRFPLIANSSANQIQELAAADQLNLTASNLIMGDSSGSGNNRIKFGSSSDLSIYHDGTNNYIEGNNQKTIIRNTSNNIHLQAVSGEGGIDVLPNAGVRLYYDNTSRLETTSSGASVTGTVAATTFSGSGASLTNLNASNISSGTVPTARLGSGTASSSTFLRGDSTFQTVNTDLVSDSSPQLGGNLDSNNKFILLADSGTGNRIKCGTDEDLQIYHNGNNNISYVANKTNRVLVIENVGETNIVDDDAGKRIRTVKNGTVELYYDNTKRIETTNSGISVAGNIIQTGNLNVNDSAYLYIGNSGDLRVHHDGSNNYINSSNGDLYLQQSNSTKAVVTGGSFRPDSDGNIDLGISSKKWQNVHAVRYYGDGSNLSGISAGGLKQTKFTSVHDTSGSTNFSTSWTQVLSLNITPSSSSNKISIFNSTTLFISNTSGNLYALPEAYRKLTRTVGGTETTLISSKILAQRDNYNGTKYQDGEASTTFQDSPNTTSEVTYKIYLYKGNNTESAYFSASTLHLMETAV